ncbi:MAG: hypothetical protein ACKV0T_28315 [Planctomycetales bacterium]
MTALELEERLHQATLDFDEALRELDLIDRELARDAWENQTWIVHEKRSEMGRLETWLAARRELDRRTPQEVELKLPETVRADTRNLPVFVVVLKSVDAEQVPAPMQFRDDDLTGSAARWRFEVRDAEGFVLPDPPRGILEGYRTAFIYDGELVFGQEWKTVLRISNYVDLSLPGEYTVTVMFHNDEPLIDTTSYDKLNQLIVFKSEPFSLTVEMGPRRIVQTPPGLRGVVDQLIRELPESGTVQIIFGVYDESFHAVISPASSQGQLLRMGMGAVPGLLDALNDDCVSPHQKAWILALLYMITDERDFNPINFDGALPDFEGHSSFGLSANGIGANLLPDGQQSLIDKWNQFRNDYLEIQD